jgi:hypothetical protein
VVRALLKSSLNRLTTKGVERLRDLESQCYDIRDLFIEELKRFEHSLNVDCYYCKRLLEFCTFHSPTMLVKEWLGCRFSGCLLRRLPKK